MNERLLACVVRVVGSVGRVYGGECDGSSHKKTCPTHIPRNIAGGSESGEAETGNRGFGELRRTFLKQVERFTSCGQISTSTSSSEIRPRPPRQHRGTNPAGSCTTAATLKTRADNCSVWLTPRTVYCFSTCTVVQQVRRLDGGVRPSGFRVQVCFSPWFFFTRVLKICFFWPQLHDFL